MSNTGKVWDAIVVGAGPAGSSLAILLARHGWDTLLLDSAQFPRPKVCGECLSSASLSVLAQLGLEHQVRAASLIQRRLRIVVPGGAALELALGEDAAEGVLGISRHLLDWLLLEQARSSGATICLGQRVRRVVIEQERVVGIEVGPQTPHSASSVLRGRVVIAAGGRFSRIVQQTGSVAARGPRLVGFKCHRALDAAAPSREAIKMVSLRGGYFGVCEVEGRTENVCGLLPRAAVRESRGSIDAALGSLLRGHESVLGLQGSAEPLAWMTMPDVRLQRATPRVPGVVYVGDALATIEPLAGQGMVMALAGASLAAELLTHESPGRVDTAWQVRYAREWRSRFGPTIARAHRLGWLLRHPTVLQSLALLAPVSHTLEEFLLRACYRSTRVSIGSL